eukprot:UN33421
MIPSYFKFFLVLDEKIKLNNNSKSKVFNNENTFLITARKRVIYGLIDEYSNKVSNGILVKKTAHLLNQSLLVFQDNKSDLDILIQILKLWSGWFNKVNIHLSIEHAIRKKVLFVLFDLGKRSDTKLNKGIQRTLHAMFEKIYKDYNPEYNGKEEIKFPQSIVQIVVNAITNCLKQGEIDTMTSLTVCINQCLYYFPLKNVGSFLELYWVRVKNHKIQI